MKTLRTTAIVLGRTDYGEADRILTFLTPDYGKVHLLARGVRKVKSKLAGGIELFSTSDITFIQGRSELGTLVSTRLIAHYGKIMLDIERVQLGYALIKELNKATEDHPEAAYFHLLEQAFRALDDKQVAGLVIQIWFYAQLLQQGGFAPNLQTTSNGAPLSRDTDYTFDFDNVAFAARSDGRYTANHIKLLRLFFGTAEPTQLMKVQGIESLLPEITSLVQVLQATYLSR